MLSFLKSRKRNSSRGRSYYERENMVHTLNDLISICNPVSNQQYSTSGIIKYNGIALNEADEKRVLKLFGKPNHIIDDIENLNNYKVLFYRHTVDKFKFLMQFHYHKNSFFFVSNMVTSTGVLSQLDKMSFINRITNKYFPELKLDFQQGLDIQITDKVNNFIKVVDGVNFKVNYVNYSSVNKQIINNPKFSNEIMKDDSESKMVDYF